MAFNVRVPELTGDYIKDKEKIQEFMKQVHASVKSIEVKQRKENKSNGN